MPVDIRSFFSKAPAASKKKDSDASSSISSNNNKTSKVDNKTKASATSSTKATAAKSATKKASVASKKKEVIDVEEEEKPKQKQKPKENKRKVIIESDDDDDDDDDGPVEVSAEDFYKKPPTTKAALKSSPKKSRTRMEEDPKPPSPIRKSPRKKVIPVKKPAVQLPSDHSEDEEDEKPKAKRKVAPKKSIVSSPKKARKEKVTPLAPGLERDEFNTDNLQVPECLQDRTFVLTGVLDNLHRDNAMDLIKTMGGRITTAVSGKTDYLVVGEILEDGRSYTEGSKYKKALPLDSVQMIMGEKQLYGLCHLYHEQAMKENGIDPTPVTKKLAPTTTTAAAAKPPPSTAAATKSPSAAAPANPYARTTANPYAKKPGVAAVGNPYAKPAASNPYAKSNNPYANKSSSSAGAATTAPVKSSGDFDRNALWVDKHAPQRTDEILGNKDSVTKLASWLSSWERSFNNPKSYGKAFSNPKGPFKAALLSGPPGIGKTTTATLVAKEAGRDLLEFNASDARSKKALQNDLGDITGSQAINFQKESDTNKNKTTKARLRCIVMDEVDGMGAGDRSGMAELIQMIKKSKVPIICICNDRQSIKMKSLVPYCLDLRFRRPTKNIMAARAVRIAQLEGMTVERNAAEAIAESCGNDVRQVLNCMQMWSNKDVGHASLTYKGLKEREHSINKDEILRVGLFDAAKTIMEGRRNLVGADNKTQVDSLFKRANAFFVDYSMVGLLVQQNYPRVMIKPFSDLKIQGDPDKQLEFLEQMHSASLAMSDYAMVEHNIRGGDMNWSLLPTSGMLTVKTGYHAGGETGGFLPGFPEFTAWMGKNSSKGKKVRLLQELHHHMNYKISGGTTELRQTYLPILRERFMMLLKSGEDGSTKAIELMDEYGLSREDVMEKFDEFVMGKEPTFADLDSKQKAALTREYNQGSHKSQALVSEQGGGVTTKKRGKRERDPADLDAIDEDVVEESDVEDDEEDMKRLQEKFKKKGRKKAAPKAKGAAAKKPKSKKK